MSDDSSKPSAIEHLKLPSLEELWVRRVVLLLSVFVVGLLVNEFRSGGPTPPLNSGVTIRLTGVPPGDGAIVGHTKADIEEFRTCFEVFQTKNRAENGRECFMKLLDQQRLTTVEDGTEAVVIERDTSRLIHVKLLNGRAAGLAAWTDERFCSRTTTK
jgi:hypothetical protein